MLGNERERIHDWVCLAAISGTILASCAQLDPATTVNEIAGGARSATDRGEEIAHVTSGCSSATWDGDYNVVSAADLVALASYSEITGDLLIGHGHSAAWTAVAAPDWRPPS